MSHTQQISNGDMTLTIHHNSDWSGTAKIIVEGDRTTSSMRVPGRLLFKLMFQEVQSKVKGAILDHPVLTGMLNRG